MSAFPRGYLLGVGSNIDPDQNFARIIALLLESFEPVHLSRVLNIPPVGMNSHRAFLNAVAFIETDMDERELKQRCNEIETSLGRDRDDPDSKYKDRPADVDILAYFNVDADWQRGASSITDEYFLYPLIDELKAYLTENNEMAAAQAGTRLRIGSSAFGEAATSIYRD
ncbi:2-amino-4-hydroxy-6-hydroxymethyldihydropteridine diphosphokinase [uncultured Methylophaga sp.]|uniref:2-amino-4-hydroxy-6- hydroxymethyldihydropteridine diphosphokinase n=1 Tax=uncultured Methylophaga sp. TaxID=285271 RepID=UPI002628AE01|nr:2-amino-4-hydroxy-6-hydroxymethyldihydropteridine diphosphokinase [uncultured Methylophaga sp.]